MAVTAGNKITGAQYNSIQSTIASVLGTGSGNSGYGQTVLSSQLTIPATSTKITTGQWQNLYNDILICYNHQNSSNGTLTYPTTSVKVSASDYNAYETMANGCLTNRLQFDSGYAATRSLLDTTQASGWNTVVRHVVTLDFLSTENARFFFNTGSQIRFSAYLGGGPFTSGTKDFSWSSTLTQMGTIFMGPTSTGTSGVATAPGTGSSIGWHGLTTSYQLVYSKEATTYIPNKYTIHALKSGSTVTFAIQFQDLSAGGNMATNNPGTGNAGYPQYEVDETVTGTLHSLVSMYYASGSGQVSVSSIATNTTVASSIGTIASPNP